MGHISTHVLDTSTGRPGAGIRVELYRCSPADVGEPVASGVTDADGRVAALLQGADVVAGAYRLRFELQKYFAMRGVDAFFPHADLTFVVSDADAKYHVPLLATPFGYTTYRGS